MSPVATIAEALARCALTSRWAVAMCGQFCAAMYGYDASGYGSALIQWQQTPSALKVPGDVNAPPGALYFWGGGSAGHGHVAVADGTGSCFSIDISGPGTVSRVPASMISSRWGLPYLGWSVPYFQGTEWSATAMIKGVDVSRYQAVSGWQSGIDFAFTKVTEGTTYINPTWVQQRDTARAAGLVVGYYHFARPGNMVAQADFFLAQISLQPGDVIAFDWEDSGVSSAEKDAWISYVQGKTGHRVILYCNVSFWKGLDKSGFSGDGLWIATAGYPAGSPPITSAWLIHQYSTAGNLDHDVAQFASRADMLAWAGGGSDMPLNDADKKWFTDTINARVTAVVKAELAADAYSGTVGKDAVRSPDDAPSNPTWALASYARESYLRLLEIKAQAQTNGASLTDVKMALVAVKATLDSLDLSHLPADVAAKITALKASITFTEGV